MMIARRADVVGGRIMSCGLDSSLACLLLPRRRLLLADAPPSGSECEVIVAGRDAPVAWLIQTWHAAAGSPIPVVEIAEYCVSLSAAVTNRREISKIYFLRRHISGQLFGTTSRWSLLDRTLLWRRWYFFASHNFWSHYCVFSFSFSFYFYFYYFLFLLCRSREAEEDGDDAHLNERECRKLHFFWHICMYIPCACYKWWWCVFWKSKRELFYSLGDWHWEWHCTETLHYRGV